MPPQCYPALMSAISNVEYVIQQLKDADKRLDSDYQGALRYRYKRLSDALTGVRDEIGCYYRTHMLPEDGYGTAPLFD